MSSPRPRYYRKGAEPATPGPCAICLTHTSLVSDHHHTTGLNRGRLCGTCNAGLGFFKDSPTLCRAAAAYLDAYTAAHQHEPDARCPHPDGPTRKPRSRGSHSSYRY